MKAVQVVLDDLALGDLEMGDLARGDPVLAASFD